MWAFHVVDRNLYNGAVAAPPLVSYDPQNPHTSRRTRRGQQIGADREKGTNDPTSTAVTTTSVYSSILLSTATSFVHM